MRVSGIAPGLAMLRNYQKGWWRSDVAAGLSQGFAVTGADSRTAINDAMGGKTQLTGVVAAVTMAMVLMFLTGPLQYLPIGGLSAVLISAAIGLFDWRALVRLYRIHQGEFAVCVTAMCGATRIPGLVIYRFNASLIFYNAPYFTRRVQPVASSSAGATWLIIDGGPIVHLDSTGADAIVALADHLASRGIRLAIGGVVAQVRQMLELSGALAALGSDAVFPSLRAAVEACESTHVSQ